MVDDPQGEAPKWDSRVPEDRRTEGEVNEWMTQRYGSGGSGVMPQDYIDQVAPYVSELREAEDGDVGIATGSDAVYIPGADRYQDPETGEFISEDDA